MEDLLDKAPCGFLTFTDSGEIALANETLARMLGYARGDELVGQSFDKILSVAGRIFYQTHFFPLLKLHDRADEIYLTVRTRDGRDLPVMANALRRERDGRMVNDCVLVQMKERGEYESAILKAKHDAEEAIRSKDEFIAVVTHDLRTPLNAILGWIRMLGTGRLDKEKTEHAIKTVERSALSLNQLIEDMLDFSRVTSGRLRLNVGWVDAVSVIEAALDTVRPSAMAKNIMLESVLDPDAGPVSGDPDRLQQVLWNLLANAIKFTPKGGRVHVRLARVNSSVEITVSDTGEGMSPEFLPYVFEHFRQAENSSTRRGGLGLGMAITRHIVELHGGTIRADSPGKGMGSTFTVRLPVMIVHEQASIKKENESPELARELAGLDGLRILVVEDDPDARRMLTTVLEHSGAAVAAVGSVAEGLDSVRSVRPDLVISDIEMPDGDGYTLIKHVRGLDGEYISAIPAIALTAHSRLADRVRALDAGFQMHISKPVEPIELVLAIANLTNRKAKAKDDHALAESK